MNPNLVIAGAVMSIPAIWLGVFVLHIRRRRRRERLIKEAREYAERVRREAEEVINRFRVWP